MDSAVYDDDLDVVLALTPEQRIERAIQKLPTLSVQDVPLGDSCPICLMSFSSVLSGENVGPDAPSELAGVTKLQGCGHVFCRLDLIEWIRGRHGTCPACRHTFLDVKPLSESDGESSDGDYIPGEDDYDEDEDLDIEWDLDFDDDGSGFSDELDDHGLNAWDDSSEPTAENWGLSDGDSLSEGDLTTGANEAAEVDMLLDDVRVHSEEEQIGPSSAEGTK